MTTYLRTVLLLALGAIFLQGCTASYTYQMIDEALVDARLTPNHKLERTVKWVLPQSTSIWVAFPQNQQPQKLNRMVKDSLSLSLAQRFARVGSSRDPGSLSMAMQEARQQGYAFMVYPKLIRHENHINSIMEMDEDMERLDQIKQDVVVLTFILMDVTTQRMVDSSIVSISGGYLHIYRQNPSDLIAVASNQYAGLMSP
ncbi:DUF4823 domain-containing protein [Maricurvus nonylphenolicus]|uniref:DUF4823 domain-containing protein n=1 Tax=Maricurvus nonylphenolicus TaxID=1008307 RepID=UPI0036F37C95